MNKQNSSEHPINLYGQCYVYKGHILDMIDLHLWIAKKYTNITPGQEKSIEVCRSQTMHEIIEYIDSHKNQKTHQGPPNGWTFFKKNKQNKALSLTFTAINIYNTKEHIKKHRINKKKENNYGVFKTL